jgi:type II secretion system protein I
VTTGTSHGTSGAAASTRGFTLIEVMVALVIVAFGMGAVLATLSSAANNIAALHDKTLAQWIALNLVADTRLDLQLPTAGTTEGDIKAFGNGDWHWQRDIVPVPSIPGLLEITVRVRRTGSSSASDRSSRSSRSSSSSSSSGASRSSGATTFSGSSRFGSSGGAGRLGLSSSSGSTLGTVTNSISTFASSSKDQNWLATIIGFRGDAVAAASGEAPDWTGTSLNGTSSSSSGASSSGAVLNPGSSSGGGLLGSSSGAGSPGPTAPNTGSSGGG